MADTDKLVDQLSGLTVLEVACEGALVAGWAESDQVRGVCEGALAVVSVPSDRIGLAFEIVLVAWVRPTGQERSCRLTPPEPSRYDLSILQPLPVYKHTQSASVYLIRDGQSRNCR